MYFGIGLNSIIVRLKESDKKIFVVADTSQFYYSSIKRRKIIAVSMPMVGLNSIIVRLKEAKINF